MTNKVLPAFEPSRFFPAVSGKEGGALEMAGVGKLLRAVKAQP
jgi:hypothetical protein